MARMIRISRFGPCFCLGALLLGCGGPSGSNVETVPASILDPSSGAKTTAPARIEYKEVDQASTPFFPAPKTAYKTDSGLRFVVFKRGKAQRHPMSTTRVTVHYEGRTTDGKLFDSSRARNEPATFALNQVIPGWREGVKLMTVGDLFRFWIPEKDAYRGAPGKPAGLLIFDVELMGME